MKWSNMQKTLKEDEEESEEESDEDESNKPIVNLKQFLIEDVLIELDQ